MQVVDMHFTLAEIDSMFPHSGEEGQDVSASPGAEVWARLSLSLPDHVALDWHLPNVFDVRYGSSYVAGATANGCRVRFHSDLGDFREGDDKM